jgi:hypothetical protein
MKIIQPINQHFPMWSFLCGDFELKNNVKLLNKKLLFEPDLLSPLENNLRWEVFKSRRNWIANSMGSSASYSIIQFSFKELANFKSAFSGVKFGEFADEYMRAYKTKTDFCIKKENQCYVEKPHSSVVHEYKIKQKLEKEYKPITLQKTLDTKYNNIDNISVALNRTFIVQENFGGLRILDGHHRLSAYYWAKKEGNKKLPDKLYAFYWKQDYNS